MNLHHFYKDAGCQVLTNWYQSFFSRVVLQILCITSMQGVLSNKAEQMLNDTIPMTIDFKEYYFDKKFTHYKQIESCKLNGNSTYFDTDTVHNNEKYSTLFPNLTSIKLPMHHAKKQMSKL
jgi:hypothetical protein